jgi:predicted deacylase
MRFFRATLLLLLSISIIHSCKNYEATIYNYPDPVDTSNRPIEEQEKKTWEFDGVFADNQFEGARLNGFEQVDKHTFKAIILPENTPINKSPWFAFKIWSEKKRQIFLNLDYTHAKHRYIPKMSEDRKNWVPIDTNDIFYLRPDSSDIQFPLMIGPDTLYISGQELITSTDNKNWIDTLTARHMLNHGTYGKSVRGRDLHYIDIYEDSKKDKPMVVILSRQHPPELSGYIAMRHFVHTLLDTNVLAQSYREKYRTLVLPMLNPDGVDMGHWRHNVHGVDMNRDWGVYVQPEIKQTVDFIAREVKMNKNEVVLGLDFHSTQEDVFYTYVDSLQSGIHGFKDFWIFGIDEAMPDYKPVDEPSGITKPYSKVWFYTQFGAESITYEIGDETPRDFIKRKARISANEMMKLLMFYNNE